MPEKTIGASFNDERLSEFGFWTNWRVEPKWNLCNAPGADGGKVNALGLLMEQVLAPRFNFVRKNPETGPVEGFDYSERGYDLNTTNVGVHEESGQFQIEIKGLAEPKSEEATRICQEDLSEVISALT